MRGVKELRLEEKAHLCRLLTGAGLQLELRESLWMLDPFFSSAPSLGSALGLNYPIWKVGLDEASAFTPILLSPKSPDCRNLTEFASLSQVHLLGQALCQGQSNRVEEHLTPKSGRQTLVRLREPVHSTVLEKPKVGSQEGFPEEGTANRAWEYQ